MNNPTVTPEERYAALVDAFLDETDASQSYKKGFGSSAMRIGGKIFAMLSGGRLVVKLPKQRVDALIASGEGERFDPRKDGRLMKEWLTLAPASEMDWQSIAREAMEFVASKR